MNTFNLFSNCKTIAKSAVVAVGLLTSALSYAANVTYLQDNRYIRVQSGDGNGSSTNNTYISPTPFANWNYNYGNQSSMNANGFAAKGNSYAYSDYGWYEDESVFDIKFSVSSYTNFSLNGDIEASMGYWGGGVVSVNLYRGVGQQNILNLSFYDNGDYSSYVLNELLLLAPDQYRIVLKADTWPAGASSSFDVNGTFAATAAPVPVPPAFAFMLSSVLGLIAVRRSR